MPNLSYSDDALNVRHSFFGAKAIIYVEGDDDILFWQEVFSRVTDEPFEIEALNGAQTLDEYIKKITAGKLNAIAARDSDFLPLLGAKFENPKVLYTFGYSIENSLYTPTILASLVRLWCKSTNFSVTECSKWLDQFSSSVQPLVILDVANSLSNSGLNTLGDNCSRYMTSEKSINVCSNKVSIAASSITIKIPAEALEKANEQIEQTPENILMHIRGHFLASGVHRFIVKNAKDFGKKVSVSAESLYAAAISQFSTSLNCSHPHKTHYLDSAKIAWQAL